MNKNDRIELGSLLLALHYRNKGINDTLDSIRKNLSDAGGDINRFQWVQALAQAQTELELTAELIGNIIDTNKTRAKFNPDNW